MIYNEKYFKNYETADGHIEYEFAEDMKKHMKNIAKNIKETINPKTVLDAGCATGHLVSALRELGIEAYGIDISEYAINSVRDDIKPYCFVSSLDEELPKELPKKFDLIINIEVIEHMREKQGLRALKNFAKYSERILFSSTPDAIEDPTHLNVQLQEYWAEKFAELGYYHMVDYDASFLSEQALMFYKNNDIPEIISNYERKLRLNGYKKRDMDIKLSEYKEKKLYFNNLMKEKDDIIKTKEHLISISEKNLEKLNTQLAKEKIESKKNLEKLNTQLAKEKIESKKNLEKLNTQQKENLDLKIANEHLSKAVLDFQTSFFWKITKPFRWILDKLKRFLKRNRLTKNIYKFLLNLRYIGFKNTVNKTKEYFVKKTNQTLEKFYLSEEEYDFQKNTKFNNDVKFSIVVPLYNPKDNFLKELVESVKKQTYSNWELCLADGGNSEKIKKYCEKLSKNDIRIKYNFIGENKGISGNTNEAILMSTGDYIALLDHDDVLSFGALFENMKIIENEEADFIYSDEVTFDNINRKIITEHYKPDFAIDNLRANNYICHFSVFKKNLLEKTGLLRPEFDGSQDHDLIFRLTENADKIYHIQKVLYFWRSHADSVAQDINSKTYAIESAKNAVLSHLERQNLEAVVKSTKAFPTIFEIKYKLNNNPLVSIIIPNKNNLDYLKRCIESIYDKTTYDNFEIIIVDNNSDDENSLKYYQLLESENSNLKILNYNKSFNHSKINNFAVEHTMGDYLVLLNNDTKIISYDWIERLLMYAQRKDVGAVGAKLYFEDDTIQHAGIILGLGADRVAAHAFYGVDKNNLGYMGRLEYAQNYLAITGACLMVAKSKFIEVGGLDEKLGIFYNDIDFCLKLIKKGYLNIFTPFAKLYHYESKTRGYEDSLEKKERFSREVELFKTKWGKLIEKGDPYFNPAFSLDSPNFDIKK